MAEDSTSSVDDNPHRVLPPVAEPPPYHEAYLGVAGDGVAGVGTGVDVEDDVAGEDDVDADLGPLVRRVEACASSAPRRVPVQTTEWY